MPTKTRKNEVEYCYGSPPKNCGYLDFTVYLAPLLPSDDKVFFWDNSLEWRKNHNSIPFDLFKNICYWKSPMQCRLVRNNKEREVNERWKYALGTLNKHSFNDESIESALKKLAELKGIRIPRASALLTAWNPNQFGVIDYKVAKIFEIKTVDSEKSYVKFRRKLLELKNNNEQLNGCSLRQIELAIWHYYSIQEAGSNKRD